MKTTVHLVIITIVVFFLGSCKKDTSGVKIGIASKMLSNKVWYLDHIQEGGFTKSYVGQTTYSITFL